ncbi:MAG: NAD(P)/FAD-dependent oxidoreductase [Deltaproteobacteria bacterium]|nr:NAD(P)/FAD-dependent oxidoreductase [Deltaproteobacteria bacterium]MCB9479307.1 NAD(P)/FAD-dependent oxidoreductase [Deltaproteobacteria bacterium]MCB9488751.1 NAD(P)/FAD-dependent oxidoreductase [Deltaproteobacteria bacterium]
MTTANPAGAPRGTQPWSKTSPESHWDYIVIGSGMGGMACAALLAKLGRKVLVIEQHYVPGGFTHAFKRKKWHWDVGVHVVGEVTDHTITGRILKDLSGDRLEWKSVGKYYENMYFPDGFEIHFPDNPREFRAMLDEKFPDEKEALDKYFQALAAANSAMQAYYGAKIMPGVLQGIGDAFMTKKADPFLRRTTKEVLDEITDNRRLKAVLTSQWGYYGSTPSESAFGIHAMVARHFFHGGFYPVGGAPSIAKALLKTVEESGGWTRIRSEVDEILVKGGKAVGVRLKNGDEISADRIISAAGARQTVERMLPESLRPAEWSRSISKVEPSECHVCLYLGMNGDIEKAGATGGNQWFFGTWDMEDKWWDATDPNSVPNVLFTSYPSLKDPLHDPGPDQIHMGEIITFIPYSNVKKWSTTELFKRGDDYEEFKQSMHERVLNRYLENRPEMKDLITYSEVSTPLSTEHFARSYHGSIYGLDASPNRYTNPYLKPRTPVKNLYLAGSDVVSCGVMGAMIGGVLSAVAAEPIGGIKYLKQFTKR